MKRWKLMTEDGLLFLALMAVLALAIMSLFHGCASSPSQSGSTKPEAQSQPPVPGKPTPPLATNTYGFKWDDYLQGVLPTALLQSDMSGLCAAKIDPRRFWGGLARSVAYGESFEWRKARPLYGKVDPACEYIESFTDKLTGVNARSVGLLQLSVGDSLNYGGACKGLTNDNLKDPERNLACGVQIMADLISKYGDGPKLQASLGRYWSTLRPGGRAVERLKIELPECK